jgi:hypothetical protein
MNAPRRMDSGSLFSGLAVTLLGVLFLLERFDVLRVGNVFRNYWPLFLVVIGVCKLVEPGRLWSGVWMIGLGLWLQLIVLHVAGLTFRTSWPLLLIALGGGMIVRTFTGRAQRQEEEGRHDS